MKVVLTKIKKENTMLLEASIENDFNNNRLSISSDLPYWFYDDLEMNQYERGDCIFTMSNQDYFNFIDKYHNNVDFNDSSILILKERN